MAGLDIERKHDFHLIRWSVLGIVGIVMLASIYYGYTWYINGDKPPLVPLPASAYADTTVDESPIAKSDVDSYQVPATHPRYISIPALGIEKARVVVVGLTKINTLDTPRNIGDTAWYDKSATPGQGYGQIVIDGHNGGVSRNGVLVDLDKLKTGDKIIVERGDGKIITYDVAENVTMPLKEANTTGMQKLMTPYDSTKEGLGLMTCAGKWIPRDKVFDERIMVRAVAE